ncbi:hypothetical protein [Acidovorax sp. NCPPB 3576]|uniref:hypothetical protein n=1 Tax=Acidovorax sp. NCPPB 3576 TaxID=2940488 RepID=UPI00234B7EDE|nr:hypothetical protein [Acidovorax sp. NCPPB 3576]WCM88831.1 hypothetical protein M5C98_01890 [Acidovorax sp. NCPPB 3576]
MNPLLYLAELHRDKQKSPQGEPCGLGSFRASASNKFRLARLTAWGRFSMLYKADFKAPAL